MTTLKSTHLIILFFFMVIEDLTKNITAQSLIIEEKARIVHILSCLVDDFRDFVGYLDHLFIDAEL